ncbi:alkaline phosphatase D family protein [Ochrovirga pacifica]|uniref:alkaline phosphatase D family protein n=1 Tax=Ochrovirga pacifica TaxID=1042376 RepID=UPI000255A81E|nr:alkaline phosphatase D family protein [Ochrovirga pacifica]
MKKAICFLLGLLLGLQVFGQNKKDLVYFTTGLKIGEVTENSAVIWTRLCSQLLPNPITHQRKKAPYRAPLKYNNNQPVDQLDGEVSGTFGEVKVKLISKNHQVELDWEFVSSLKDYTFKKVIKNLKPNTTYKVEILGRKYTRIRKKDKVAKPKKTSTKIVGQFTTAPSKNDIVPVFFTSSTCQYFWDYDDEKRGFKIYDAMKKLQPNFHCQTGDFVYYDKPGPMALNIAQARMKWHAINAWPASVDFYNHVPLYLQKDDHDLLSNDSYPGMQPFGEITYKDGLSIWYEQAPLVGKPYRTFRWGKDVQIWLLEGREFRSPNYLKDGKDKTIYGEEQKKWFAKSVKKSDATFKLFVSATPVVGPDRVSDKSDNHANIAFKKEGDWLRKFLKKHNMFVLNGDRHWQYVSKDTKTGLMEFSQGPSSDAHAQGWSPDDKKPEHKFLRVAGGFLGVKVYREKGKPIIEFIHYDVDGNEVNKEVIKK